MTPAPAETLMQIGEAASRTGLSLRTLRHWEEVGLVRPSARSTGGFRLYSEADLELIRVIMTMKPLDLSLLEIRELLSMLVPSPETATSRTDPGRFDHYIARTRVCMEKLERHTSYAADLLEMLEAKRPRVEVVSGV